MRRKTYIIRIGAIFATFMATWYFFVRLPSCRYRSTSASLSLSQLSDTKTVSSKSWQIPEWVLRYNVSHFFDWTWHKNSDYRRCRKSFIPLMQSSACRAESTTVENDVLSYFRSHSNEGCIVDNAPHLPVQNPHPFPRARSLSDTCSSLHIDRLWNFCNKSQSELDKWLSATARFVTFAVFNAFIDTGYCYSEVPGTVFTERATFHLQAWTKRCGNGANVIIPKIKPEYRHTELIDSLGHYLHAPGHFGPQQLPRLLRLLATAPATAKVLVAKGGVADLLIDILIDRGVVTRDRIVQFDKDILPNYFANIVYRSETWPHSTPHYIHDRTSIQLVHRVIVGNKLLPNEKKDRVILIKRKHGGSRSIVEHLDMATFMLSTINKSKVSSDLHIEIFEARGHIREHIALFRRARVIVGPHGAGMMNVLWSSPGTHVVEVGYTTGMTYPEMYAEISLRLEQRFWICKGYGDYTKPIHVDMNDFMYIFNQIIHEIEIENG